ADSPPSLGPAGQDKALARFPGPGDGSGAPRRDADFGRRLLHRLRHDRDVLDVVKLARVGEIVFLPGALDDLETLNLAVLAFGIGDVERLIGLHDAAAPDAEDQPALGDVIQDRAFLGDANRITQRKHLHAGPDP